MVLFYKLSVSVFTINIKILKIRHNILGLSKNKFSCAELFYQ